MDKKIGPTGEFPFGQPVDPTDRGGLHMGFRVLKPMRQCVLSFGTMVEYVNASAPEALQMVQLFREAVKTNWGDLPYNKSTLPIAVSIVHNKLVQLKLPVSLETLVCNPEVILALCEVIEDRLRDAGLEA